MMEFTLSRVVMYACGLMVLVLLISPVSSIYNGRYDDGMYWQADRISETVDAFYRSDMRSLTVEGRDLIPEGCLLTVIDGMIVLEHDGREFVSYTDCDLTSYGSYSCTDTIMFSKDGGSIRMSSI